MVSELIEIDIIFEQIKNKLLKSMLFNNFELFHNKI